MPVCVVLGWNRSSVKTGGNSMFTVWTSGQRSLGARSVLGPVWERFLPLSCHPHYNALR